MAMRISSNTIFDPYQRSLNNNQIKQVNDQLRLATGKDLINLSDDPKRVVTSKNLTNLINRNSAYRNNIESTLDEFLAASENLTALSDKLQRIRQIAIDASTTGSSSNLYSFGVNVKGILDDVIKDANSDFNGHFLFSGTKTTAQSLDKNNNANNDLPFELIKGTPDAANPSGLKVVFKGNNEDRIINKDNVNTEIINAKAKDMFGQDNTELFNSIINLYNILSYKDDGSKREDLDSFNTSDIQKVSDYQKQIADSINSIDNESARFGGKYVTLDNLRQQMNNQELVLKDVRSKAEDTDVAKTTLNLQKENLALQYTLQIGARLLQPTLFDFLS